MGVLIVKMFPKLNIISTQLLIITHTEGPSQWEIKYIISQGSVNVLSV